MSSFVESSSNHREGPPGLSQKPEVSNISTVRGSPQRHQHQRQHQKWSFQMPHPSTIVALDCEMVGTGKYGGRSSVARVTLIDWEGNPIVDTYVSQNRPVTDYRTFVSGITKENLEGATMTLEHCRELLSQLLYNRILVGHALKNDMEALGITHPWWLTRDTATYLPFMKKRVNISAWWPRKLKELANEKLEREIQILGKPHSPFQDALAALDLYKTVQSEWESDIFSSVVKTNKFQQQQIAEQRLALIQHQKQMYNQQYHKYYQHNQRRRHYLPPHQQVVQ